MSIHKYVFILYIKQMVGMFNPPLPSGLYCPVCWGKDLARFYAPAPPPLPPSGAP